MTKAAQTPSAGGAIKTAAEALLVAAVVFGIGWGATRLAEKRHAMPVKAGEDGTVRLTVRESDWRGNTEFHNVNKFSGYWHCEGDWQLQWLFAAPTPGEYVIELEAACPQAATTATVELSVGEHRFPCTITGTSDPLRWHTTEFARLRLDASPHTLTLKPAADAPINVKTVIIRPAAATTAPTYSPATTQP